jgi:hypothetical protein
MAGDDILQIGMAAVDFRIDHADRNIGAFEHAMDIGKLQLAEHVLSGVALHLLAAASGGVLSQRIDIVDGRCGDDLLFCEQADRFAAPAFRGRCGSRPARRSRSGRNESHQVAEQ